MMENINQSTSDEQESIFSDLQTVPESASTGKRFLNYIIDLSSFYLLFLLLGIILAFIAPSTLDMLDNDSVYFGILDRILSTLAFGLYMSLIEGLFKGKTLGKLITRTRAVNEDGTTISWQTAFKRGFSRIVPFEPLSGFGGYPWHDKWTNTIVTNDKKW